MTTFAELVNGLFRDHRKADGREYSNSEVSRAIDGQLSPDYIAKVRKGDIPNPGRNALLLLCQFFKVSPVYFFPELNYTPGEHGPVDHEVEVIAKRAAELSPEARRRLAAFLEILQPSADQRKDEENKRT